MEDFLPGLLRQLARRCVALRDRLAALPADPEVRDHAIGAYQAVETIRREVEQLLADPSLGVPALLPNHLQLYKRWNELAMLVESYPLPFVERFADPDRRLTRLARRLAHQVGWPHAPPLVAAFSTQYYWTLAAFDIVCTPAAETMTLLGLPDLCHELGHILLLRNEAVLLGNFLQELIGYVDAEQRRVAAQQRPREYMALYHHLLVQWRDRWLREFVSDMVATFLVGPAFGWQHVRLCAGQSQSAFHPTLGEAAEHPADEARLRGIVAVLEAVGRGDAGAAVNGLWGHFLQIRGEAVAPDYGVCYPQALLDTLARCVVAGCRTLGLRGFDAAGHPATDVIALIDEAWQRFLADPTTFGAWEGPRIEELWRTLGVPSQ